METGANFSLSLLAGKGIVGAAPASTKTYMCPTSSGTL
jgi:hypothetical protein